MRGKRVAVADLEPAIQTALRACEQRIDTAQADAWHALRQIHDEKLYTADGYSSFKEYVEQRYGYSKSRAYQFIDHAKIVDYLKSEGVTFLPGGEGLTRPLTKLRRISKSEDDFLQRAAVTWKIASDTAPKAFDVPLVTTQHVESTMGQYGIYRNAKKTGEAAVVSELRGLLTKLLHCEALKISGTDFVEKHGSKAFPNDFRNLVDWLMECAEVAEVEGG